MGALDHKQYIFVGVLHRQLDVLVRVLPDAEDFIGKGLSYGCHVLEVKLYGLELLQSSQNSAGLRPGYIIDILMIQFHLHASLTELERFIGILIKQIGECLF